MSIPIGIKYSQTGQASVINSLKGIEKGTNKIRASTVAVGNIMSGAFKKGAQVISRFAIDAIRDAGEMAQKAREGEQVAGQFTDSGLAGAEALIQKATEFSTNLKAAFVNNIPALMEWIGAAKAQIEYWITGSIATVKIFFANFGENFKILGANIGIFIKWLGTNWRGVAFNMAEVLQTAVLNSLGNIKRFVKSVIEWVKGNGWTFEAKAILDGADLIDLPPIEFKEFKGGEEIKKAWEDAAKERDIKLDAVVQERLAIEGTTVRQEKKDKETKTREPQLASMLVAGSAQAATAIAKIRAGENKVQNLLLAETKKQSEFLKTIAAKDSGNTSLELVEVGI